MHLYLHVPFCKQACYYCDFHFSVNHSRKLDMVNAMCREIELQKDYLSDKLLKTIYLGGGTPSLLTVKELDILFQEIQKHFDIDTNAEITLEANPDDITSLSLHNWKNAGINRLSIGIQSFHEPHLKFLNRAHTAAEAEICVRMAQDCGFENQTIDLIYGIPADTHAIWEADLEKGLNLGINHFSGYCLTIEDKTVFGNRVKKKLMKPVDEEFAAVQFEMLLDHSSKKGFESYEISNFARKEAYSKHNTSYWQNETYLGIGPSAHSYNGSSRQWNISNNTAYLKSLQNNELCFEMESLSPEDRANELLMTGLRTKWGVSLDKLKGLVNTDTLEFKTVLDGFLQTEDIVLTNGILKLTGKGKLKADRIASELFFTA